MEINMNTPFFKKQLGLLQALSTALILLVIFPLNGIVSCTSPANAIGAENCLPGITRSPVDSKDQNYFLSKDLGS
jgi:hypothetical protein